MFFRLTRYPVVLVALVLPFLLVQRSPAVEPEAAGAKLKESRLVTLVSGERFEAEFAGVDEQGQWLFKQEGKTRKVAAADLVQWGVARELPVQPHVYLSDGSLLRADLLRSDKDYLYVAPATLVDAKIPLENIRAAILLPPNSPAARRSLLADVDAATGVQDRIVLKNQDEISGVLVKIGGNVKSIYAEQIEFRTRGAARNLLMQNVSAIIFNPVLLRKPSTTGLHSWMVLRDGSRLLVSQAVSDGEGLMTITLACGLNLFMSELDFVDRVQMIQPTGGKAKFLAEMKPLAYRHTPFLSIPWAMHLNANAKNGPLQTAKGVYLSGVGMHSRSRVAFALGGKFKRFLTSLAVDKIAGRRGSVTYRVYLNRDGAWKPAYESDIIRGGDAPVHVSLNIEKAAAMLLIVDFADRGDEMDFANWLNACVVAE